ncbi:MAG: hypothetical protein WBZ36_03455 [Candidatus Nitrosopolaris sp.]
MAGAIRSDKSNKFQEKKSYMVSAYICYQPVAAVVTNHQMQAGFDNRVIPYSLSSFIDWKKHLISLFEQVTSNKVNIPLL